MFLSENNLPKRETRLIMQILSYLMKNPGAKDTLEGIASWWLLSERIDDALDEVSATLQYLVAEGFLVVKQSSKFGAKV